ncbi:hypothetical protein T10_4862 [Trichinella papuae]|uniref:Uncharacterized protein n=1 Tax=Trichinella papuae TaxID=268474 RepID=A0A0V1LX48_9BILA|nr:hypothetical protein T10_4862 [Trichinella papuae]
MTLIIPGLQFQKAFFLTQQDICIAVHGECIAIFVL